MMSYPPLRVKKLFPDAQLPVRGSVYASGMDVFAYKFDRIYTRHGVLQGLPVEEMTQYILQVHDRILISTGLSVAIDPGYEIQVRPRSGNALKKGLTVLNTPGTIDADYRGTVGIILINLGHEHQVIDLGERIAQLVVAPVCLSEVIEVTDLDETTRGTGGFGSTGTV